MLRSPNGWSGIFCRGALAFTSVASVGRMPTAFGQKIYWTNSLANMIQRADLDASNIEDLVSVDTPRAIAIDTYARKIYWASAPHGIMRSNLDGSVVEEIVVTGCCVSGLALDVAGGKMYWTAGHPQDIRTEGWNRWPRTVVSAAVLTYQY